MAGADSGLVDPKVWDDLQSKLDDDTATRDQLRDIVQVLEKQVKKVLSSMTAAQSASSAPTYLQHIEQEQIPPMIHQIQQLASVASQHPYYKFNQMWTMKMQDATFGIVFCGWCGGFGKKEGELLTIDEVGNIMGVPVNLKDRDAFHLTIEEYLHALVSLIEELARLARNSVTQGNYQRPLLISQFVKDLHAGFQILNLKNDSLRRRSDAIKYKLREIEDVIYDLSLRNLLPKTAT